MMKKKILSLLLITMLIVPFIQIEAAAADYTITSDGTYDLSDYGSSSILTIEEGLTVTLTNTSGATYTNMQIVCEGAGTSLTIEDVIIDNSSNSDTCAIAFNGTGNTLTLKGSSSVESGTNAAAVRIDSGTEIDICGDGSLTATGSWNGAAIGSGTKTDSGTINIYGSVNITTSGDSAASIGSGYMSTAGDITIWENAVINASTYGGGAAIGSGAFGDCGTITIKGNAQVTAECTSTGAGIGIGASGEGGTINILGYAVVDAQNTGVSGSGIGSGHAADDVQINIYEHAKVYAYSKNSGAAIGGGYESYGGTIKIYGNANVTAEGLSGTGIGSGESGSIDTISIYDNAEVTATVGNKAAGIGSGKTGSIGTISIYDSADVTATGGSYGAGIGSGLESDSDNIEIYGNAVVSAEGGYYGAGIGAGQYGDFETITISDSAVVTATGGERGAGIGGGGGSITISGGTVFAYSDNNAQDIGASNNGSDSGTLSISGESIVLFATDNFAAPTTSHYYFALAQVDSDGMLFGITLPEGWTQASGYHVNLQIDYDINGGTGTVPNTQDQLIEDTLEFVARSGSELSYTGYFFVKWNTAADDSGTDYYADEAYSVQSSMTLYAVWSKYITNITLNCDTLSLEYGESYKLTADLIPSGTYGVPSWTSSDTSVAVVDQDGNVTGTGEGTATITASTESKVSDTCEVTVSKIAVSDIILNYSSKSLFIGEWVKLSSTVSPSDATYKDVTWTSSDTSVATVTGGIVTAIDEGTATITATADGVSDSCTITVSYNSVTSVTLSSTSLSMYLDDTEALTATVLPTDAENPSVTWTSSDTSIATVTSGVVKAVGEGACTITAEADGVYDTCSVYVGRVAVTSVELSYSALSMYVDDQRILTADVSPSDATNPDVTWTSSDESVATVNSNGVVTAVSVGSATITATADGVSDTCFVTVNDEPEVDVEEVDFIIENSSVTVMYVGDTLQLSVAVTPSDATDTSVTWASSDTSVITVSSSGKVTAVAVGDATITVTAQGNISASYKITVKEDESEIEDEDEEDEDEEETETLVIPTETAEATAEPEVIIQYEETDVYLTFDLDVSNLAEGAKYIQLPNDEVIDIEGKDVVRISILTSDLDDGSLEIVTLDEDMVPLGSVTLSAGVVADSSDEDSGLPWFTVLIWTIGAIGIGAGGMLLFVRLIVSKK